MSTSGNKAFSFPRKGRKGNKGLKRCAKNVARAHRLWYLGRKQDYREEGIA